MDEKRDLREVRRTLEAGGEAVLPVADEEDRRRTQRRLAKRAEKWGFRVEIRSEGTELHARRSDESAPLPPRDRGDDEERRARRAQRQVGREARRAGGATGRGTPAEGQ